jgi:hypothetical protein
VFRRYSPTTGQVVQQFPEEAILRQRAYAVQLRREELALAAKSGSASEEPLRKNA